MVRSTRRRTLLLERLEAREVMSAGAPTADTQYMLELINEARTAPQAAAQWIQSNMDADVTATLAYYNVNVKQVLAKISSATPQPALAWSNQLASAAQGHSQDMANTGVQTHTGSDGSSVGGRLDSAGYTNRSSSGENAYAYGRSVNNAMEAFLLDWGVADDGHFRNLLQPGTTADQSYRDVGIGLVSTSQNGVGPLVVTQDFGSQVGEKANLLGVVFNDSDNNQFYSPGEGQGGATIKATNAQTGQTSNATSAAAGGYQLQLDPGTYHVSAQVGSQVYNAQDVTIGTTNVKVDFNLKAMSPAPSQPAPVAVALAVQKSSIAIAPAAQSTPSQPAAPPKAATPAPIVTPITPTPTPTPAISAANLNLNWVSKWSSWTTSPAQTS